MLTSSRNFNADPQLDLLTGAVLTRCRQCGTCQKECAFLQTYGTPGAIAALLQKNPDKGRRIAYECSLCGLCTATCQNRVDLPALLLEHRREAVKQQTADLSVYAPLLAYEKRGVSERYAFYGIPENCSTVFFPGCTLAGTRSTVALKSYLYLKGLDHTTGIVLDCCTKPSHDLGLQDFFNHHLSQMTAHLKSRGIKKIITACPSCHKTFSSYPSGLEVTSIYEIMAAGGLDKSVCSSGSIAVHDSCQARFDAKTQDAVRSIIRSLGFSIIDMPHSKTKTYCCGEGSGACFAAPKLAKTWRDKRSREAGRLKVAGYCAGCTKMLSKDIDILHVLDLVFTPQKAIKGKIKGAKAPFTYINRLNLKRKLKNAYLNI